MPSEMKSSGRKGKQDYIDRHKVDKVELFWPHPEPLNPEADIADIIISMEDGSRYRGTVTTLQFIKESMERATREGGGVEGDYWFGATIIMMRIDEAKLATIVEDLIDSFMFEKAFQRTEAGSMA